MARLRSYVLNIARANGAENIARALWIAAIDPTVSLSLEFRVCGARLRQRSLFDRDVYGSCRAVDVDLSRWSCGGAVHGRSCTTSRAGFLVGCGHEAESLDIAEPPGKRVLDQARRQRRRPAPATDPQKREHLRLRPRGQQDKQCAADLDQVQPAQERSAAPLPHRAHAVRQLERGE